MSTFGWRTRLRYGAVAGAIAWVTGWLIASPFEIAVAWRYVDGHARQMPGTVAEGLVVWAAFSLFMGLIGFVPVLPLVLVLPPGWIVRRRWWVMACSVVVAVAAINFRMGLLTLHYLRHPDAIKAFFFSATNFFVITFAVVVVAVYVHLARRRLGL